VVTDALNMKALYNGSNTPQHLSSSSSCRQRPALPFPDPELTHSSLLEAVNNGTISEERINRSVARILQAKRWLKLRNNLLINLNRVAALSSPPSHRELASELSKRSITLTANAGNIPLKIPSSATVLHLILSSTNRANPAAACTKEIDRHWQHATHIQLSPATDPNTYLQAPRDGRKTPLP